MRAEATISATEHDAPAPASPRAPLAAVLDVGVSKIVCLAARRDPVLDLHPGRPIRVLGVGQQTPPSTASGKAADFSDCARAIAVTLGEAGRMAGEPIDRVVACYSGPALSARIVHASVRVRGRVIGPRDIEAALDAARRRAGEPQRRVLQFEPLRFTIDESEPVLDPIGFAGRVLSVEGCAVSAPSAALEALTACVRGAGAEVEDVVVGPAAAASAVMSQEEREGGALLIDLGAGSIGLAAFAAEGLVHAETLAMGGVRLTRDLAQRLETSFPAAERVKLAFSALRGACDPRETVPAPRLGRDGRLEASAVLRGVIADTVTPRLVESLVAVKERLALAGFAGPNAPARAVLVGGGAHIAGIRNLAAETLGMPVRLGRPIDLSGFEHGDASPAYACAAGALRRRLDADRRQQRLVAQRASIGELADHLRDKASQALCWLRDNF